MTNTINIGKKIIGQDQPVYLIAEVGSNHDGSLSQAKEMIISAAQAGADAVKFQAFQTEKLFLGKKFSNLNSDQLETEPLVEIFKNLELPDIWLPELIKECQKNKVEFLCTPFDEDKARILSKHNVAAFKVASSDLTHHHLLELVAEFGKPVILSTGTAYLGEVEKAVHILEKAGCRQIILMHCISNYPTVPEHANLKAITTLKQAFGYPVGFSDHSLGSTLALAAVTLGACIIEKHITIDREMPGPDHSYAMEIAEFAQMVKEIRALEKALGDGRKQPASSELLTKRNSDRSLYSSRKISQGEYITEDMLIALRPKAGIPAIFWKNIIGLQTKVDIPERMPLTWEMLQKDKKNKILFFNKQTRKL